MNLGAVVLAMIFLALPALAETPAGDKKPEASPAPSATPEDTEAAKAAAAKAALNAAFSGSQAKVVLTAGQPGMAKIDDLKWETEKPVPVSLQDEMTEVRLYAVISGKYTREDWALLHDSNRITAKGSKFEIKVLLEGKITNLDLIAVGPDGDLQKERIMVVFDRWDEYQTSRSGLRGGKRWTFTPGVGITYLSYNQPPKTKYPPLTQISITPKASFQFVIKPPSIDIATSVFYTALPLYKSPSHLYIQVLGANLRLGYVLPFVPDPWRVSLQAGGYYNTVVAAPKVQTKTGKANSYGYRNISGPQIFPSVRRIFKNGDSASTYLKYSPIMYEFSFLGIRNREIAVGFAWGRSLKSGFLANKNLFVSVDAADLEVYKKPKDTEGLIVRTVTVGMGLGF